MLFVDNQNITDPRLNLAIEEYLLRHVDSDEPILLFYINEPAVIIGRNQNTLEEIDTDYVAEHDIHVVRRLSGGGAVYHDLGNLNFSFVTNGRHDLHNFAKFTKPVVTVLRELGLAAALRGSSDIFVGDKKVSGNAQYSTPRRMFSHGTLLFDTDIAAMLAALNPRQVAIESRAVQSVRNFVANIRELLPQPMAVAEFRTALLRGIFGRDDVPTYALDTAAWQQIEQIANGRYRDWEWNVGHSPKFNVQKSAALPVGNVDARIDVAEGRIQGIRLYGNFYSKEPIAALEAALVDVRYTREALLDAVTAVGLDQYFPTLTVADFVDALY